MADAGRDFPTLENESGITLVEREEIQEHIEKVATENRIPVEAAQFSLKGTNGGVLLPFLVNAGAAVLVAAVILALSFVFRRDDARIQTQATQYASIEGRLIRELRQQSTEQLTMKDQEIEAVRKKVQELEQQQKTLAETYAQKLKAKEEELRQKLAQDLTTERSRLVSQGVATSDLERRMAVFEAERKAYYEKQLAEYRRSLDAEKAQLASEIRRLRAEYDARLGQLERERQQIVTDYQARETALRIQLEQKTQVLERANAQNSVNLEAAQRQLAALGQRQEDVQAVANQIDGQIGRINRDLGAGQTDAALADVHALQAYLGQSSVRSISQLADRVRSEVLLLEQLDILLQDRARTQAATAGQSVTTDLERLVTIRTLAAQAAAAAGPARLDAYRQLVASLPEVQTAAAALVDAAVSQATDDLQKKIRDQAQKSTAAAVRLMQAGDYAGALSQYRAALRASPDLAPDASRLLTDLLVLGYRISDYTRTGRAAPGTDQLAAQAGIDLKAERASFLRGVAGAVSQQEAGDQAAANQQVAGAAAAEEQKLRSQLADAQARISRLETQRTQADAQHAAEISAIAARVKTTRQDLMHRLDSLLAFEGQVNDLHAAYASYSKQEAAARAANPQDPATASREALNTFLRQGAVRTFFSDLADRINALYSATQNAGSSAALADAADIISSVAKQPTVKASRQALQFEIQNAQGNERLVAILNAVDSVLTKAPQPTQ